MLISDIRNNYFGYPKKLFRISKIKCQFLISKITILDINKCSVVLFLISQKTISDIRNKCLFLISDIFILDIRNYTRIYEIIYLFFLWSCLCCLWLRLQCLRGISNFKSKTTNHANVTQILDMISAGEYKSQHALNGTLQPKSYISTR